MRGIANPRLHGPGSIGLRSAIGALFAVASESEAQQRVLVYKPNYIQLIVVGGVLAFAIWIAGIAFCDFVAAEIDSNAWVARLIGFLFPVLGPGWYAILYIRLLGKRQERASGELDPSDDSPISLSTSDERTEREKVEVEPYDPKWTVMFRDEKEHLLSCLPKRMIRRIEHFGSTAVPGLAAKATIDMLVEVSSLGETRRVIVPILTTQGYQYFERPATGDGRLPFYVFFIKRDEQGKRTHHIHMVEATSNRWNGLVFRDYLILHPDEAQNYGLLKRRLCEEYPNDRAAYTAGKNEFIANVLRKTETDFGSSFE